MSVTVELAGPDLPIRRFDDQVRSSTTTSQWRKISCIFGALRKCRDVLGEPCGMAVKQLDTLLAIKVLSYAPGLTANARAVGALLIDRYNRKTGRCDPGLEGIARPLGYQYPDGHEVGPPA